MCRLALNTGQACSIVLVRLAWHAHSQDEEFLYLVMEYLPGGDVMVTPWLRCPGRSMCKAGSACTVEQ